MWRLGRPSSEESCVGHRPRLLARSLRSRRFRRTRGSKEESAVPPACPAVTEPAHPARQRQPEVVRAWSPTPLESCPAALVGTVPWTSPVATQLVANVSAGPTPTLPASCFAQDSRRGLRSCIGRRGELSHQRRQDFFAARRYLTTDLVLSTYIPDGPGTQGVFAVIADSWAGGQGTAECASRWGTWLLVGDR